MTLSQLFQSTEHVVRALSNLHERLHHSLNLYLLPSSTTFVSNGEFIYPCVLVLLPFVVRAISLLFIHINCFQYRLMTFCTILMTLLSGTVYLAAHYFPNGILQSKVELTIILGIAYTVLILFWNLWTDTFSMCKAWSDIRQSLQFIACLFVIYTHAPLVLCHVSLAYPSTIFWGILLAFPLYSNGENQSVISRILSRVLPIFLTIVSWPPMYIVPHIFLDYTVYVCFVYLPLHFLFMLLVYSG